MSKHTPGPWRITPGYPADVETLDGVQICTVDGDGQNYAGEPHDFPTPDGDTADFNAILIAAAPEMLEALRHIAETRWDSDAAEAALVMIQTAARAALAKARGE